MKLLSSAAVAMLLAVGGAASAKDLVETAKAAGQFSILLKAVAAAGLDKTLAQPGPYTVFAPTDAAFKALPPGTVETLVKPENKATLTKILTHHVVAGRLTAADLVKMVKDGGGKAMLKTVEGESLTVTMQGNAVMIGGAKGGMAQVSIPDVMQSNGVIHVVNAVLLPN